MEAIIEGLAQYGPLGLWTASLLWMNWQIRKDAKEEERILQDKVIAKLAEHSVMLEKAIDKIDSGLTTMREKYAEDRIKELNRKNN